MPEKRLKALESETLFSYHVFMLPFVARDVMPRHGENWCEVAYAIEGEDAVHRYNEYTYFHDFVRPVLFNEESGQGISRYFEYANQKGEYIIEVKGRTYRLEIDGIALRHFENGVGILSFHLINRRYDDFDDILRINDFGRHLYPQFLGDALVEDTINSLLACSLTLALDGQEPMRESFDHYRDITYIASNPHRFPCFIEKLLDDIYGKSDFTPIIDDRMYLICHLLHDEKAQEITRYDEQKDACTYEESDDWYRFVFVDNDQTNIKNVKMKRELIAKSTYPRWSDYDTLYGVTRYSFMLLTQHNPFALDVLNRHIRTVYFQMVTLQLAYRAMALIFTKRVTKLLEKGEKQIDLEESTRLYYDYLDFINRIYFREVTPQEQGIELYDMMKSLMRTERDFKELDVEISELHNYIDMRSEKSRNDRLETISKLGAVFLPPTLLAGMFGMNMIDFGTSPGLAALSVLMIFSSGYVGYRFADTKEKKETRRWGAILFILLALPIFLYIINSAVHLQSTVQKQSTTKDANATNK
jgi:hypothetical protein